MKNLNVPTLTFLIQLKAANGYWFNAMIGCAKHSPKTLRKCISEAKEFLKYTELTVENVNVFMICRAVNSGDLTTLSFDNLVNTKAFALQQQIAIRQVLEGAKSYEF